MANSVLHREGNYMGFPNLALQPEFDDRWCPSWELNKGFGRRDQCDIHFTLAYQFKP